MYDCAVLVLNLNIWYRFTVPFSETYKSILKKTYGYYLDKKKQSAMYCTRLRNQRDILYAAYGYVMCRCLQTVNFLLTRGVIAARLRNT